MSRDPRTTWRDTRAWNPTCQVPRVTSPAETRFSPPTQHSRHPMSPSTSGCPPTHGPAQLKLIPPALTGLAGLAGTGNKTPNPRTPHVSTCSPCSLPPCLPPSWNPHPCLLPSGILTPTCCRPPRHHRLNHLRQRRAAEAEVAAAATGAAPTYLVTRPVQISYNAYSPTHQRRRRRRQRAQRPMDQLTCPLYARQAFSLVRGCVRNPAEVAA